MMSVRKALKPAAEITIQPFKNRKNRLRIEFGGNRRLRSPGNIYSGCDPASPGRFTKAEHLIEEMAGISDQIKVNDEKTRTCNHLARTRPD